MVILAITLQLIVEITFPFVKKREHDYYYRVNSSLASASPEHWHGPCRSLLKPKNHLQD